MKLADFTLSASSLKVADRCPRLFRFVYLDRLVWPAEAALDFEEDTRRGKEFHRVVELHTLGQSIETTIQTLDPELHQWWKTFKKSEHQHPKGQVWSEVPLWVSIEGLRVTAVLDRLEVVEGFFHIVDWKTERYRTKDKKLNENLQVRMYPLLLTMVGTTFNQGQPILPSAVRMELWFAQYPDQPFHLVYSPERFQQDYVFLQEKIRALKAMEATGFPMTTDLEICNGCVFRSRCYSLLPEAVDPDLMEALAEYAPPTADPN